MQKGRQLSSLDSKHADPSKNTSALWKECQGEEAHETLSQWLLPQDPDHVCTLCLLTRLILTQSPYIAQVILQHSTPYALVF